MTYLVSYFGHTPVRRRWRSGFMESVRAWAERSGLDIEIEEES